MFTAGKPASSRILAVRLSAMGDIIHTLPAVAWLKQSHPGAHVTWLVEPQWAALLEGNPYIDRVIHMRRKQFADLVATRRELRSAPYDFAVDFQGLLKSALAASAAHPAHIYGFHQSQVRERLAALFYSHKTRARATHIVDRNMELAAACAGPGGEHAPRIFPLPPGSAECDLPSGEFVLASPLAGWKSKQWPIAHYRALAVRLRRDLGIPLVLDGPPGADFAEAEPAIPHHSSIAGLIYVTRRAAAVVGVDSGPLHLAAALGKPGVAIFGPTDPARNGPYGESLHLLRTTAAATTYKRGATIDPSMLQISPDQVFELLRTMLHERPHPAGSMAE
ncbi:MAG: lipopolysaccharide heptosyltransferase [Candidatus Solibacter sp.]|nr:lipopolysaccharide heptosyltransferase [Candidatus Solibacter sp.]